MSQIALTNAERTQALRQLGYTEREADFLCLAALHGGYFLRRQYDGFLGQAHGGTTAQLIEKTLTKGHARAFTYRHKTNLYHLCTRPFYEALGQGDNRNRRARQPLTIKNKLMGLDFVLEHRQHQYLATEQEKLDYFARTVQLPRSTLPVKLYQAAKGGDETARYFVDKFPIFLPEEDISSGPPVVSFCFVDEGLKTLSRFETYLAQYRGLFASLPEFHLIYVAATNGRFEGAQRAFEGILTQGATAKNSSVMDPEIRRLLEYFAARRLYETKQFDGFDRDRLIRLRKDREEFSGHKYEALYEQWKTAEDRGVLQILAPETTTPAPMKCTFSTHLLEHDYDLFGTFAAV
jgi:hypothetical protein